MIASRELAKQVWVAPANTQIQGVLGLLPVISDEDWADLFDLQFNLVRREPRDFRAMSAHTLSDTRDLLQISVRRLLIQLRKAALERGMEYVFRPNNEHFREAVRLEMDALLRLMFAGGAFTGAIPEEAYEITTSASVNTPQSVDQGRFIAEIRVAPSEPMEFITVLLTRIGEDQLQATEV
jgi:phage tail sheath protein FI